MLEVRLLFVVLSLLWDRLGELDKLYVHKLVVVKRILELILESVEDWIVGAERRRGGHAGQPPYAFAPRLGQR